MTFGPVESESAPVLAHVSIIGQFIGHYVLWGSLILLILWLLGTIVFGIYGILYIQIIGPTFVAIYGVIGIGMFGFMAMNGLFLKYLSQALGADSIEISIRWSGLVNYIKATLLRDKTNNDVKRN